MFSTKSHPSCGKLEFEPDSGSHCFTRNRFIDNESSGKNEDLDYAKASRVLTKLGISVGRSKNDPLFITR